MAHIEVQKKRGINPIWWIIGLVVVIAIVWWIVAATNDRDGIDQRSGAMTPTAAPAATATPSSLDRHIATTVGVPNANAA